MKKCTDCGHVKELSEFYFNRHSSRHTPRCKECTRTRCRERARELSRRSDAAIYANVDVATKMKFCPACQKKKVLSGFRKDRYTLDGFHNICVECDTFGNRIRRQHSHKRVTATFDEIDTLYASHPYCHYCKIPLERYEVSLDHKEPLVGDYSERKTSINNLTISCWDCNRLKWTMNEPQFFYFLREYRDRLIDADLGD